MSSFWKCLTLAVTAAGAMGCARGPNVSSDLPLRRVVVYRNGVGYFERAGEVDADAVSFKMRGRMVGDFLATLAIVERGGGSVRSASFPIDVEEAEEPEPDVPEDEVQGMLKPWPSEKKKKKKDPNALRDVVLRLEEGKHNLSIGYVAETPVWRPSYRVVVQPGGQADLQTWGIVQNLSGEDWHDVELVLVAGAPIAFQSTLGTPVVPARPVVSDTGEVIAAVPQGETSLAEAPPPPPMAAPAPEPVEAEEMKDEDAEGKSYDLKAEKKAAPRRTVQANEMNIGSRAGAGGGARPSVPQPATVAPGYPGAPQGQAISAPRRMSALAAVALEAGTTRYALPQKVSVPDESATMVLLVHQRVPGSAVFLFAPDGGVPDSSSHPFRVVRFTNATSGMLERGPIAVFEKGSFLGEGVLEPLPPKATATVPFALERGIAVQSESKYDSQGARIFKIEAGQLWLDRDSVMKTTYKVKNGGKEQAKVLVRHYRQNGARLFQPPPGTEDNVGTGTALVPVDVPPYGTKELLVDERTPAQQPADWTSDLADIAVKSYVADTRSDPKVVAALKGAWVIRDKIRAASDEREKLAGEQAELERSMDETRASLKVLEKNKQAYDLVAKLTERLRHGTDRLDGITKRLIEIDLVLREQGVRLRDALREITLSSPLPPKE